MSVVDRIFERVKALGLEQKAFAEKIGASPKVVSSWKAGNASYRKYLPEIAEALGTTVGYLLTGEGETKPIPANDNDLVPWPATDDDFVNKFEQLTPYSRALILTLMRSLLSEDSKGVMDSAVNGLLKNQAK